MARIVCTVICTAIACPFNLRHDPRAGEYRCELPAERALDALVEVLATIPAPALVSGGPSAR